MKKTMIKRLRGIVKQFLPYGYMCKHLKRTYGIEMSLKARGKFIRAFCYILPFGLLKDRKLMASIAEPSAQAAKVHDSAYELERKHFLRSASVVANGNADADYTRIASVAELLRRGDRFDMIRWWLEKIVIHDLAFPGRSTQLRLAALLHHADLLRLMEYAGAHDTYCYRRIGALYNLSLDSDYVPFDKKNADDSPILSFIVPVFNAERYLVECLESICGQTEKNIEVICIDDGSVDASAAILDAYAAKDRRVRVVHQKNAGVSAARNKGLDLARGRYVSFVDGDDMVESDLARSAVDLCENQQLDIYFFDFRCFDTRSRKVLYAYWCICNHKMDWILGRVFSFDKLPVWRFSASASFSVIRRQIIESVHLRFAPIKLGEDAIFMYSLIPLVKRAWCTDRVKYHYRKGNPSSAVARLSGSNSSNDATDSRIRYLQMEADLFEKQYLGKFPDSFVRKCADRMTIDFKYHVLNSKEVAAWFYGSKASEWFRFEVPAQRSPLLIKKELRDIEERRRHSEHDLYLVAGQLKGKNIDPIDSWLFFRWLQDHGVPSRYLVWQESDFARRICHDGDTKDVIFTKTDCRGDELLEYSDVFVRLRAFVVEWQLHTYMDKWLRDLPDCRYVFLQHGVIGTCLTEPVRAVFHGVFNDCNVSSERERMLIDGPDVKPEESRLFVGGLPRYDLLRKSVRNERKTGYTVFVMMTWRDGLNRREGAIEDSAYYRGLRSLMSDDSCVFLRRCNIRLVLALHHSLAEHVQDVDFGSEVELARQDEISKWIREADGMITDFSSVACDFMFQRKPTIFWIPDKDDPLLDRVNHLDGGKVDSALALQKNFYNICNSREDVLKELSRYAENEFRLERDKVIVADTYFDRNCESFSQRVYDRIEDRIKKENECGK